MGFLNKISEPSKVNINGIINGIVPADGAEHVLFYKTTSVPLNFNKVTLDKQYINITNDVLEYLHKNGYQIVDIKITSSPSDKDSTFLTDQTLIIYK